jgi:hypothetical protein
MPPGSSIILNASITSIKGNPAFSVYSASKAAVRSFARNWTLDLKDKAIRINAISPRVVPTPGYNLLGLNDEQLQGFIQSQAAQIPLGRVGNPTKSPKRWSFWLAMTVASSTESNFSWTVVVPRFNWNHALSGSRIWLTGLRHWSGLLRVSPIPQVNSVRTRSNSKLKRGAGAIVQHGPEPSTMTFDNRTADR